MFRFCGIGVLGLQGFMGFRSIGFMGFLGLGFRVYGFRGLGDVI